MREDFNTLYCDPGEDFGWCIANGSTLLAAGTEKMWLMAREIDAKLKDADDQGYLSDPSNARDGVDTSLLKLPIGRMVCEDWRLYPGKLKALKWDKCRTARVIGAITWFSIEYGVELVFQPASIKDAAQAAGAEEYYYHPHRPNRHQNDAIQHWVFFMHTVLMNGLDVEERYALLGIPNNAQEGGDAD